MKEKKTTSFGRTILLNLGDRDIDDDDPLEYVDGEVSAEDEVILNIVRPYCTPNEFLFF